MNERCSHCSARFWQVENGSNGPFNRWRKIHFRTMQRPTPLMESLLIGEIRESNCFFAKARAFNTKCSFASVLLLEDSKFKRTRAVLSFRISGSIYHKLGAMTPPLKHTPQILVKFGD